MNMIAFRRRLQADDGIAMLMVIAVGLVATILVVAMFSTVLAGQKTTERSRNITSAQAAAEAGLDDVVYQLGNFAPDGTTMQWSSWPNTYNSQANPFNGTLGNGATYQAWFTPTTGSTYPGGLIAYVTGKFGTNTRTIRAVLTNGSPHAFDYSMFGQTGIDIHHHGSSYLSPQAYTTAVHSNGYIKIDYPAEFTVNTLEAVGNITFGKSGGSDPAGTISAPYNWFDPLSNQCFPGGYTGASASSCNQTSATAGGVPNVCPSTWNSGSYGKLATIFGTVRGGSVTVNSNGEVWPVCNALTLGTGGSTQTVGIQGGDVYAGTTATIGSSTYSTAGTYGPGGGTCSQCGHGQSTTGGQIGGSLYVGSQYTPSNIQFPSINYATTYRAKAIQEGGTTHFWNNGCVPPSGGSYASGSYGAGGATGFLSWLETNKSNWYVFDGTTTTNGAGQLVAWNTAKSGGPDTGVMPDAIVIQGTYDICGSSLSLAYGTIQKAVATAAGVSSAKTSPVLVVAGSLVVETGGLTLNNGLVVVGTQPNVFNLLNAPNYAATPAKPVTVNVTNLLDASATFPGVVATGGSINSTDYDTDSPWTAACGCYQPTVSTPIYIRGLVYSASYSATTKTSTPQNQHWHNFDPKNLMKIFGSQVGDDLHDCNNFTFTYDPLVKKAFGFGGGTVSVVDYQELGT